jgi:hypothetical protein
MEYSDADFLLIGGLSSELERDYSPDEPNVWADSTFHWISAAQSARKGAVGKKLVRRWAEQEGMSVTAKSDRGHDFCVDGLRVAVKLSLVWADGGFVFEQIRDQKYDVVSLLALEPARVRLWVVPKEVLWEHAAWQHKGAAGRDTKWLLFPATEPPAWLKPYGGQLARAKKALKQARRNSSG